MKSELPQRRTLRSMTPARIALGRIGASLPLSEVLALQAAELQMSTLLEQPYDTVGSLAGTEAAGSMKAPARPGGAVRPDLPTSFARLSRTTSVTAENRTFPQLNNHTVEGKRLEVTVTGPDGSTLARLVRFRGKEPDT